MATPLFNISEIQENQSGKYITHNEALALMEGLISRVLSRIKGDGEITAAEGDTYIVNDLYSNYSAWAAATSYDVGDEVVPTTHNGFKYECITAGTSGNSEPTWPTTIGNTVIDGGAEWECVNSLWNAGSVDDIAHYYSGTWHFLTPIQGFDIWCQDENVRIYYDGSAWSINYAARIDLNATLNDQDAVGMVDTFTVDTNSVGFGAALYIGSDGNLDEAVATDQSTMPCMTLALDTGTGTGKQVLFWGRIRNDAWSFTVGNYIYVDTTSGQITDSKPSNSGDVVQVVGIALASNIVFFNSSYVTVEIS